MAKFAQHARIVVRHVPVILCARVASQGLIYKMIIATTAPQELTSMAQLAQHAQTLVQHAQVVPYVRHVSQDMVYRAINAAPAPQELI